MSNYDSTLDNPILLGVPTPSPAPPGWLFFSLREEVVLGVLAEAHAQGQPWRRLREMTAPTAIPPCRLRIVLANLAERGVVRRGSRGRRLRWE